MADALLAAAEGMNFGGGFMLAVVFAGVAVLVAVGSLSHESDRAFSAAISYVALGAVAAAGLWLLDVRPLSPISDYTLLEHVTEITVIIACFAAGLTVEQRIRRSSVVSIAVLLLVVMPATVALIAVFGQLVMGLSLGAAVLLGAILAPTDPVLAGDVGLGPPGDRAEGEPRLSLHTEAGMNDGLAFPFVLLGIFIAEKSGVSWIGEWLAWDLAWGLITGVVLGAVIGGGAAWLVTRARSRGFMDKALDGFAAVGLVFVAYGTAELAGGYGFIACFCAGLAFRRYEFEHEVHQGVHGGVDAAGNFLELATLLLLGSMLTLTGLGVPGVSGWLLAPLLILVIRPALVLAASRSVIKDFRERLFLAIFGVRGVATLYYGAIVAGSGALSAEETEVIIWTAIACVIVSIVFHGVGSAPFTRLLLDERTGKGDR